MIVWEFVWADSALVVLDEWSSYRITLTLSIKSMRDITGNAS